MIFVSGQVLSEQVARRMNDASLSPRLLPPVLQNCRRMEARCSNKQSLPNLRKIGRICANLAKLVGNERGCESNVFAKSAQICAKFTAPLVTVPSVLVRARNTPTRALALCPPRAAGLAWRRRRSSAATAPRAVRFEVKRKV